MRHCAATPRSAASSRCSRCRAAERKLAAATGYPAGRLGTGAPDLPCRSGFHQTKDRFVRKSSLAGALAMTLLLHAGSAWADGSGDPAAVKDEDGKYYDAQGNPTYKVADDKSVDWYTYSGFRRY